MITIYSVAIGISIGLLPVSPLLAAAAIMLSFAGLREARP